MHRGALVIRKLRWGIKSMILGVVLEVDSDKCTVLWADGCTRKTHVTDALQLVDDDCNNLRQRTCTSM